MNAKTLEAITKHGNSLLAAFPNSTEKNPVALCKKLKRIENVAAQGALSYCNGGKCYAITGKVFDFGANENDWEDFSEIVKRRVEKILGILPTKAAGLFVNGDARGYSLKLCSDWTRAHNRALWEADKLELRIHTDMGSYGILAPDLNTK